MPDKSSHSRGKHHQSKRSKAKQRYASMVVQQPVSAETPKPAAATSVPAPAASVPATPKPSGVIRYPYITSELRRIGILAGIIIVILIVLALVLS